MLPRRPGSRVRPSTSKRRPFLGLRVATGRHFCAAPSDDAGRSRPGGGDGHGQEWPHWPQDHGHAGFHRHARHVCAPGRSQSWRPGHDQAGRSGAGHLQQRGKRGTDRHPARAQAPGRATDGHHRRRGSSTLARHAQVTLDSSVAQRGLSPEPRRPPPAPRRNWPWATHWRWRCWMRAGSRRKILHVRTRAVRWDASCSPMSAM